MSVRGEKGRGDRIVKLLSAELRSGGVRKQITTLVSVVVLTQALSGAALAQYITVSPPAAVPLQAGDLQKALQASTLGQPGAKPFHIRVEISQTAGPSGDYNAVIEETWISPTQWVRTVKSSKLMQETLVDGAEPWRSIPAPSMA